ncbi:hypothetical protein KAR26_03135 [Candidatus Parcubacteria bacterium]|nr:hypothetical protein [Candidatus Parcubacteria bacterium]
MILGHKKQQQFLKKSAELDRISHAYLFHGPSHLGKKTIAVEFIKLINCQNPNKPCGKCRSCEDIQKNAYPDLTVIEPEARTASKGGSLPGREIKIGQIKKLQKELSLCSYQAKIKAAIINKAECMNQEAQNCFLKTLEEPKGKTLLILIAEHPETLLPTILSRMEKIKFSTLSYQEIEKHLLALGAEEKLAQEIALISEGRPGIAIELFSNPQRLAEQKQRIKEIMRLVSADISFRFQYAKTLAQSPEDLPKVLDIWTRCFRNALLAKLEVKEFSTTNFKNYSVIKLKNILKTLQIIRDLIAKTNANPKLALEMLMIEL